MPKRTIPNDYFETHIMTKEKDEDEFFKSFRKEQNRPFKPTEECSKQALTFYPMCKYAKILNLPNDIKKNWLEGAKELLTLAFDYWKDKYKHSQDHYIKDWLKDREYDKVRKYVQEQIDYFKQAEQRIKELEL
jgi:hypothetical protein